MSITTEQLREAEKRLARLPGLGQRVADILRGTHRAKFPAATGVFFGTR